MAETLHDRLQLSKLLEGPVDTATVEGWPPWAHEHLRVCPSCQSMLAAERQLRAAVRELRGARARALASGPPSREQRLARLASRRAPPLASLISSQRPLVQENLRFAASPLELRRTSRGIRIWHPDAHVVLVLAVDDRSRPRVIAHREEHTPGVGLDLAFETDRETRVLALASHEPLEPEHWLLWLQDAQGSGQLAELVEQNRSPFVHAAAITIPAPLRSSLLRVEEAPLPETSDAVAALLGRAATAGREDDSALAAALYREALEQAFTHNDRSGQVKAGIGIAYAFKGMGYPADGDQVLRWVIEHHSLDARWAAWVCEHMASDALNSLDLEAADAWLQESQRINAAPNAWVLMLRLGVHHAREEWAEALDCAQQLEGLELPALQRAIVEILTTSARAQLGRVDEAEVALGSIEYPEHLPLEAQLQRRVAEANIARVRGTHFDWATAFDSLLPAFREKDCGILASWDHPPLLALVELATKAGEHAVAARLLRLRFLDTERAESGARLLAACSSLQGVRLLETGANPRVRSLRLSSRRLEQTIAKVRAELRSRDDLESARALGHLLFNGSALEPGPIWVGSDGLLADVPMLAVAAAVAEEPMVLPHFRELLGMRRSPPARAPGCSAIVSLADAQGNLPWADQDVTRDEAAIWLRGKQVTRSSLTLEEPCGLLHLGLHARREQGIPELLFADGPMGPLEIGQLSLPGAPVVLLAGCFTAVTNTERGVERSLADAFLRAGASAVIATKWPVLDREMHAFVRALIEAWPFDDVAACVARTCLDLRRRSYPARCWAAPVVY